MLAATAAGCDVLAEEQTFILSDTELSFTYRFQGSDLPSSGSHQLISVNTADVDVAAVVEENGFALADLRSITVESATLGMAFPPGQDLGFLERVAIDVLTDQLSPVRVAERAEIPDGRRQLSIPVNSTVDIGPYVRSSSRSRLQLTTDQELPEDQYEMDVMLQLAIEVGGL